MNIKKINCAIGYLFILLGLFGGFIICDAAFNLRILCDSKSIIYMFFPMEDRPMSAPMFFLAVSAVVGAYLIKE